MLKWLKRLQQAKRANSNMSLKQNSWGSTESCCPLPKRTNDLNQEGKKNARCIVPSFIKPDFTEADASRSFQQIQDEWRHLLSTPYSDFFPQDMKSSFIDNSFTLSSKKTLGKIPNRDAQACKFSEIAAWLEFFG